MNFRKIFIAAAVVAAFNFVVVDASGSGAQHGTVVQPAPAKVTSTITPPGKNNWSKIKDLFL